MFIREAFLSMVMNYMMWKLNFNFETNFLQFFKSDASSHDDRSIIFIYKFFRGTNVKIIVESYFSPSSQFYSFRDSKAFGRRSMWSAKLILGLAFDFLVLETKRKSKEFMDCSTSAVKMKSSKTKKQHVSLVGFLILLKFTMKLQSAGREN